MSLISNLYEGSAALGRLYVGIAYIFAVLVGTCLFIYGIYNYYHNQLYVKTKAKIDKIDGTVLVVSYILNDIPYQNSLSSVLLNGKQDPSYVVGKEINIWVNPLDEKDIILEKLSTLFFVLVGFFIILITYLIYWLANNNKLFASIEGIVGSANLLRNL